MKQVLTAGLLALSVGCVAAMVERPSTAPVCGVKVVSYKFVAPPGTTVTYGNRSYTISEESVEVIAQRDNTFRIGTLTMMLPIAIPNQFGTVAVIVSREIARAR
jgi:hypothetical protein